ncbi:uncharacterized protein LOC121054682 [Oryza brachyantha]|uniref:uncharacterized protein LOC121054682 n=1 Tax=Oryza brachyantha TaxID=4533 RepID=UPI001ADCB048|nr:uncharacterized protein LOC121054682 [Oryza brachyantha]
MASTVGKHKNLVVYFDHDDSCISFDWDDIIGNPATYLPKVINPKEDNHVPKKDGEKLPGFYRNLETNMEHDEQVKASEDNDKSNTDSESDIDYEDFLDSDYELEDGDDDLFAYYVDETVDGEEVVKGDKISKGKKAKGSILKVQAKRCDDSSEDEDLEIPEDGGDGGVRLKFRSWREEDINNPTFRVGLVFPSVQALRVAIAEYAVRNRVQIKMPRNDKQRIRAHCSEGCSWNLFASEDSRAKAFVVKTYFGEHNCPREWVIKQCTAKWLAQKYIESFRADDKMSLTNFSRTVQKEWNLTPSRSKLARARRIAMKAIYGDEVQQYNKLWDYGNEIRKSNPGSTFYLKLKGSLFSQCYMSLDACKRRLLSGCRPIICLDGCHIKTKFGGQLLTAIGMDPNDCIYPIAMAVVEVESLVTWKLFLETLVQDLGIDNTSPWTIMTDKQKYNMFFQTEHRFCVRHLYSNFQGRFKGEVLKNQLWACARSSSVQEWNTNMEKMKAINQEAHEWLEKMPPSTWVKAFFSEYTKCDILLNNNCEVFKKYILDARELPILSMFEKIKGQIMTRHYNKQKELVEKMQGTVCPKIRKKVLKNADAANLCYALPAGQGIFQVQERDFQFRVDIIAKSCDCRRWNLTGIPCNHAISCLRHERIPAESVLPECYSTEAFSRAYGFNIWPCSDQSQWENVNGPEIQPPMYEKKVGRPPKSRRKQPYEVQGKNGPKLTKHGAVITCSHCKGSGHNSKGCKLKKDGISSEDAKKMVAAEQQLSEPPSDDPVNVMSQASQSSVLSQPQGPLPDSQFILDNRPPAKPAPLTTCSKEVKAAATKKRKVAQNNSAVETKKRTGPQRTKKTGLAPGTS